MFSFIQDMVRQKAASYFQQGLFCNVEEVLPVIQGLHRERRILLWSSNSNLSIQVYVNVTKGQGCWASIDKYSRLFTPVWCYWDYSESTFDLQFTSFWLEFDLPPASFTFLMTCIRLILKWTKALLRSVFVYTLYFPFWRGDVGKCECYESDSCS